MTKIYDDKYSTKVAFNAPIMRDMLSKRDITLVQHWFENGEPNKKLALEALKSFLLMEWIEPLDLLWDLNWITKKAIVSNAWSLITSPYGVFYKQPLKDTPTEKWVIDKTYNHKILSKNELNHIHLTLLEGMVTSKNNYYWDMFFTDDINMKGSMSEKIFHSLNYFSHHDHYNSNSEKNVDFENLSKERFERYLSHKNGFEVEPFRVLKILVELEDVNLFWKIMSSKFKMDKKNLFVFGVYISLYFKGIGRIVKKMTDEEIDSTLDTVMKYLVNAGLTESVTFTKKDLMETYSHIFSNGYISFTNLNMLKYLLSIETTASHLPYVHTSYYYESKIVDITFSTGEAFFAKPVQDKWHKFCYKELSQEDKDICNAKMKSYLK